MDIHRSNLREFILPKEKSIYVIDYYEGIQRMLLARPDFKYENFLSRPRLRTATDVVWSFDGFVNQPKMYVCLSEPEKSYYSSLIGEKINEIDNLIHRLENENDGAELLSMLIKVMAHVDESSVYCGDGQVALVNWGMIPRLCETGTGTIYRAGNFSAEWKKVKSVQKTDDNGLLSSGETVNLQQSNGASLDDNHSLVDNTLHSNDQSSYFYSSSSLVEDSAKVLAQEDNASEVRSIQQTDGSLNEKQDIPPKPLETTSVKTESPIDTAVEADLKRETNTGEPVRQRHIWKKILYSLLGLGALYLLTMFCLRNNQGPIHLINPFYRALPRTPYVEPLNPSETSEDEAGIGIVATDRLNILFDNASEESMSKWATEFKRIYRTEEYKVTYHNASLGVLQISVPSSERMRVKSELPSKMSEFVFEIYEEAVSGDNVVMFNDPDLKDSSKNWYFGMLNVYGAWDITTGSADVVVAIVDNGFDLSHPELKGKLYKPYNACTHTTSLRPVKTNYPGNTAHGTHVAATAVGNADNGLGVAGIAPHCKLMPIQVGQDHPEGLMSNAAIIDGVMYAIDNGADVINLSLGKNFSESTQYLPLVVQYNMISSTYKQEEIIWSRICEKAKDKNVIIVFAAGNENIVAGLDPQKRNPYAIKVSATDEMKNKTSFSNYGYSASRSKCYSTVSAPGCNIFSAAPDESYMFMNGTSMSAPIVTGAVALMRSVDGNIDAATVSNLLQNNGVMVNPSIGPLIDIQKTLLEIAPQRHSPQEPSPQKPAPSVNCQEVKKEIAMLQSKIDSLLQLCPKAAEKPDTLKYRDVLKDPRSMDGVWESTTQLIATTDGSPVKIFMSFKNLKGTLTIVNKDIQYTAPLEVAVSENRISLYQVADATSPDSDTSFSRYDYTCTQDIKGSLSCKAVLQEDSRSFVTFNLVKVE